MSGMRQRIPAPADYATIPMPAALEGALLEAWRGEGGCYRASVAGVAELRPFGLCEINGPYLTAFGMAVRRELLKLRSKA